MTVSCCSWWWSDKTIKNVSDQRWWSSKQPSRATVSLEKSVFFFFYLQWFKVTECLDSLCPKRHGESQPSAAATLTHLTKWTWVFGREFHQLLQYSEIWQSFTGASKNTLSRAPSDSVSVQDAGMMRGPQVQLCVCVCSCTYVFMCVCVSPCHLEVEGLSLRLKCSTRHRRHVYFSASGQKKEAVTKSSEEENRSLFFKSSINIQSEHERSWTLKTFNL